MQSFHRVIIADLSSELDLGLIGFGARIAGKTSARTLLAVAPTAARFIPAFTPVIEGIYNCVRAPIPECRVLPPRESPVAFAEEYRADLMLVRYSGLERRSRETARRLMWEAPCSVWLCPWEQNVSGEPQICPAPEISWLGFALRRDDAERVLSSNGPVLSLRTQPRPAGGVRQVMRDLFALQEPQFN